MVGKFDIVVIIVLLQRSDALISNWLTNSVGCNHNRVIFSMTLCLSLIPLIISRLFKRIYFNNWILNHVWIIIEVLVIIFVRLITRLDRNGY